MKMAYFAMVGMIATWLLLGLFSAFVFHRILGSSSNNEGYIVGTMLGGVLFLIMIVRVIVRSGLVLYEHAAENWKKTKKEK
jgi:hypothetical protein